MIINMGIVIINIPEPQSPLWTTVALLFLSSSSHMIFISGFFFRAVCEFVLTHSAEITALRFIDVTLCNRQGKCNNSAWKMCLSNERCGQQECNNKPTWNKEEKNYHPVWRQQAKWAAHTSGKAASVLKGVSGFLSIFFRILYQTKTATFLPWKASSCSPHLTHIYRLFKWRGDAAQW